ncbi:polysaccharide deacetylase family protein [soil metagenome]
MSKVDRASLQSFLLPIFLSALAVVFAFLNTSYIRHHELTPAIESPKTDMKYLPKEIKKQIATISPTQTIQIPILMYHYVEYVTDKNDPFRQSMNINPDIFDSQMKTLSEADFTFLQAKELAEILDRKRAMPKKPILITLDDGHWDVDTVILPILKKYHITATAYIIPGFTNGSDFMTQEQITHVISSGLIEIGSHTVHHIALKDKSEQLVIDEVTQSKKMLEDTYHIPVVSFAYPSGSLDLQAIKAVQDAGYSTAVSTIMGKEHSQASRYFLYRIRPGIRTGPELLNFLEQNNFNQ